MSEQTEITEEQPEEPVAEEAPVSAEEAIPEVDQPSDERGSSEPDDAPDSEESVSEPDEELPEHIEDAEVAAFAEGLSPEEAVKFLELVGIGRAKRKAKIATKSSKSGPKNSPIKNPFAGVALVQKLEAQRRPKKRFGLKAKAKDDIHAKVAEPEQPKLEALESSVTKSDRKPQKRPGGELKALEEELAKTTAGKISGGFQRRAAGMIQFLGKVEKMERAAILVRNEEKVLEAVAVAEFSSEEFFSQTSRRLLKYTQLTKQPLMVIDCARDNRFARDPEIASNKVRSVICVPFTDFLTGSEGLIYLDNTSEPDAFSYEDLKNVEAFAELVESQADLGEHEFQAPAEPEVLQTEVEPTSPWIPVAVLVASVLLIVPAIWSKVKPAPKPTATPVIAVAETSTPDQIVLSYLRALGSGATEGAYYYLSEDVRGRIDLPTFEKAAQLYLSEDRSAYALMRAQTSSVEVSGNLATVSIEVDPETEAWRATLIKSEDSWHITALDGGPQLLSSSKTVDS